MALGGFDLFDVRRLLTARQALLPLPLVDRHPNVHATDVFPPFESRPAAALSGKRVGVIGSGGGGACVSLVGVARAFEEAGIEPAAISASSGSVLWGAMWAAGVTAEEMAGRALSWRPEDHLGIQWANLPRFAFAAVRGFDRLAKGRALEQLFDRRLWHMSAGATDVPLHTVVYNTTRGRVEYFGSVEAPDLTLGELARIAVEPVRVEGEVYIDGGVVDGFPAEPLERDGRLDRVFGLNVLLPSGFDGQAAAVAPLELARRSRRSLGERLTLIEPVEYSEVRHSTFYDLFLDRRRWPDLMRWGYEAASKALRPFRSDEVNSGEAAADKGRGKSAR